VRWALIAAGGLAFAGLVGLAGLVALEWTYIQRLRHHPANPITDVDWYQPREPVAGAYDSALPRKAPQACGMQSDALEAAATLADTKNASALLVARPDAIVLERYWRGQHPDGVTNSASMAKTITALLVGIALDEGLLPSLDEPAASWLPAWKRDARKKISLRHLLQMHSGLRPMGEYTDPFSDAAYLAFGTDLRYVVDHIPAVEEPGVRFDYNNVNYQALGAVLEAATGGRYAEWLSQKLWKPLGSHEAWLWLDRERGDAHTSGFMFAIPEDWARVGLCLLHDGMWNGRQLVSRGFLQEMKRPSPSEPRYGLGIWLAHNPYQAKQNEEKFSDEATFYLDGHAKQRVYISPTASIVVVRVGENAKGWDEAALPNAVLRAAVKD
jgi:CubicO group peptidase (beta-lactamase class C family)